MAQVDNSLPLAEQGVELSSVKRALVEIRRLRAELDASRRGNGEPIAIIGLAVRLPGGVTSPNHLWKALAEGEDLITTIPPERWDARAYWSAEAQQRGTMYDIHGGFLANVEVFDADFFGIHPREAASMDPQQRILLELTWEALERAMIDPRSLMNTQTGIYLGLSNSDYAQLLAEHPAGIDGYTGVGAAGSIAAGRIAYFLGTHGPAMVVDTACSSSLVAVHQAVQSLRRGETDLAIVGTANLILSPDMNICFSRTGMLSPQGRCKTFDASADGYVRAEGCCVIVMKRLTDAVRDSDRVMAVVRGTAVNQDGRSAGITAPNGPAQEAVMRAALRDAGVEPDKVDYIEAHGTGTPLGDPMEVQAIGAVYGSQRSPGSPLRIGSVKTNLGHTEAASGLTGLIKVILMMQPAGGIAPHLHFKHPSPQIEWQRWNIEVPQRLTPWSRNGAIRYAGVSSFGFSGTNAHIIVSSVEFPAATEDTRREVISHSSEESLLCLSAAQEDSLRVLAERYIEFLRHSNNKFADICHGAATGRAKLPHRLALRANSSEDAAQMLEQWLAGHPVAGLVTGAPDKPGQMALSSEKVLDQIQKEFVEGGPLRHTRRASSEVVRRINLPTYPFQRKRFWFGALPHLKRQKQCEAVWQSLRMEAERQSKQGPLGWSPAGYSARWRALEGLTRAHAHNTLVAAGAFADGMSLTAEEVVQQCGFQPIYLHLVRRWLEGLAKAGTLVQTNGSFRAVGALQPVPLAPHWEGVSQLLADDPGALAYLRRCGMLLGDVLTGRKSALETLFPDGSFAVAEGLYESSVEAKYFNPIVASAVQTIVQGLARERNVRILELGGGTGGTTSAVLPLLPARQVEYWFTDVSELFLRRAGRKFGDYSYVHYTRLDIDRSIEEQGFMPGIFDAVVAANVVHAARNLESALHRIKALLSPHGVLVLLETTHHHSWFDMTTGLIEGWQHFEDSDRREHPLLTPAQWRGALERTGFEDMMELPASGSPAATLGQHVLLARCRRTAEIQCPGEMESKTSAVRQKVREAMLQSSPPGDRQSALAEELLSLPRKKSEQHVSQLVRETICGVFQLDIHPENLTDRDRLSDLGMDSLIALELRDELSKKLGLGTRVSSTIAFDTGTVGELVSALAALLVSQMEMPALSEANGEQRAALWSAERAAVTAEQLQTMSEEDVEKLLTERLSRR